MGEGCSCILQKQGWEGDDLNQIQRGTIRHVRTEPISHNAMEWGEKLWSGLLMRSFHIHTGSVAWWRLLESLTPLVELLHLHEQHLPFLEMVDMQKITKTGQHKTAKTHSKQRKPEEPLSSSSKISPSSAQKSSSQTFTHRQHVSHTSSLLSSEQQQFSPISVYQCFSIGIVKPWRH